MGSVALAGCLMACFTAAPSRAQEQAPPSPAPVADPVEAVPEQPATGSNEAALREELAALKKRVSFLEEDIDEVIGAQDRLADRVAKDTVRFTGDYRVILNNFHLYDRETGLEETSQVFPNLWSHRLRLAMTADAFERVRFYGRMTFVKNFGELIEKDLFFDSQSTRFPRDTSLRIERAQIDWFITDWLVLTAGRITAPEGPPAELKENTERSATWGVQMVEAEFEALMLTLKLDPFLKDSYLRPFYLPFSSVTDIDPFDDNSLFVDIGIKPMDVFGTLLELKIPGIGDNLVQTGVVWVPAFRPRFLPIFGVFPEPPFTPSLGWFAQTSFLFEWKDIFRSGLDLFGAYNFTYLAPNGETMKYDFGDGFELPVGLASFDDPDGENTAHFVYTGGRYTLPFGGDYAPKIGFEFNWGSKYNTLFSSTADTKINKLATRGSVYDAYAILPLVPDHLFARLGVMHLIREFEGSFVGPATPTNESTTNVHLLLHASW